MQTLPSIKPLTYDNAPTGSQVLLQTVKNQLGMIPNLHLTLAHSPAALEFYTSQTNILSKGVLARRLQEQIALATAGANACNYCASAHTLLGANAGLDHQELACNLSGSSSDRKTQAVLDFAKAILESRGQVADEDVQKVRQAGFAEAEIVEIVAHIGMNLFTNYFNLIAGTEVDFPLVITRS
jgi:uncharacterized peroxidase-related enzyme